MTTDRIYPIRFANRALALGTLSAFLLASCGGGGSKAPTSPGGNTNTGNTTITNVSITGNTTSVDVGSSATFGALAKNSAGTAISTAFAWTSSNTAVATVGASTGTVTGVAAGTAVISASAGGFTGNRSITVSTPGVPGPAPFAATVDMPGTAFQPSTVTVAIGGTVTWVFTEVLHNVAFGGGSGTPQSIPDTMNASVQRTFTTAGTFNMTCTLHAGMTGIVTVR